MKDANKKQKQLEARCETNNECILSDIDRDLFLSLIENPLEPNEALKLAMARFKNEYKGE
ncbi:hypothetical protein DSM106972_085480 [Dulcicalothrix desertica PCC 7102]|uniref:DUF1778 domain-containing protein n=1 Tax=Dulcicalothrix desertica PCC 7102 TaxID=232991 RepID=A0A3S1CR98_9CYAN|nr:hypothetical protein [Dulcicalothrix desertica]RUS96998.1 hypothetical protein DSM106972_085480 [Dulcicalothrix desertica PCC 7102]TWH53969.1 hypothetical protein CAL7102_01969 [Dulcicalothrix desertica PCC 7102]